MRAKLTARDLPFMLMLAVGMHIGVGAALIAHENVASISALLGFNVFADIAPNWLFGGLLIAFGLLAGYGLWHEHTLPRWKVLASLAPQYCLIFSGLCVSTYVLAVRELHDVTYNFWFIFAGLWPGILIGILHTWAVLNRYIFGWRNG